MNRIDRLLTILQKKQRRIVGLMSGTSVDAIDAVVVDVEGHRSDSVTRVLHFESFPFPAPLRNRIFRLFDPQQARVDQICNLDFIIGELFAEAALQVIDRARLTTADIDVIGCAGQTIWHDPEPIVEHPSLDWLPEKIETRSTLAIGQSAVIAERTGIVTVGDLRVRDVAAGGHGAPLVAYADWVLLRDAAKGRCIQNIGGIGNVTWLPANASLEQVIAFDTGPGNMVIDALAEVASGGKLKYDKDGAISARGRVQPALLDNWLGDPYFRRKPPKTTGREHFGVQFARRILTEAQGFSLDDLVATATALTARSIADAYETFLMPIGTIDEVIVGGGGALNPTLLSMLRQLLGGVRILRHEDVGIDSKAKEALAIAIIANDSLAGMTTNVEGATGGRPTVLGKVNL